METLREKMIVIRYHLQAGSAIGQKTNSSKLLKLLSQYKVYREKAKSFNPAEFMRARLKLRLAKEQSAQAKLKTAYGKNFNETTYYAGIRDTDTANADHLAAQHTEKASATPNTHKAHIN